jgi:hypothetical protein
MDRKVLFIKQSVQLEGCQILMRACLVVLLAALFSAGCDTNDGDRDPDATDTTSEASDSMDTAPDGTPEGRPVDILFVIHDSTGMSRVHPQLSDAYPVLIQGILAPSSAAPPIQDLHVGVISTDAGTGGYEVPECPDPIDGENGELLHEPSSLVSGCDSTYDAFLSYGSETPDTTQIDWIVTGTECIATLGTDGCWWSQALKATEKALVDHRDGVNAGFQRSDSILVIVFISDRNDCSVASGRDSIFDTEDVSLGRIGLRCFNSPDMLQPIDAYTTMLSALRSAPSDLLLGFIIGVAQDPACEGEGADLGGCLDLPEMIEEVDTSTGRTLLPCCGSPTTPSATPARRFIELAQDIGNQAHVQSICDTDYTPTMAWIVDRIQSIVGE